LLDDACEARHVRASELVRPVAIELALVSR